MKETKKNEETYTMSSQSIYNAMFGKTNNANTPPLNVMRHKYQASTEKELPSKETALRRAAAKGNVNDIEYLINDYSVEVNSKSSNGFTALDWAYKNNQMTAVDTLCWLKADQSILKPLLWKYVLDNESEWPKKDIALWRSAEKGNIKDVRLLVEKYEANINIVINKTTPIEIAQQNQRHEIVHFLEEIENKKNNTASYN